MDDEIANDPANRCFGCGPANPSGLRLRFARDGGVVRSTLLVGDDLQGMPGRLHTGVLQIALMEVANWTVYGLLGRVGFPLRTGPLEFTRRIAVGETLSLEGRLLGGGTEPRVETVAIDAEGREVARLTRDFDLPDPDAFANRLGYPALPSVYAGDFSSSPAHRGG
ncbi:MAG TPA: hypothetical protein VM681_09825 [Candidatus Thermoplasmatota archaeon]|nr:hypothetical protein [Candidatus Thermoplasmatota archaeon]